MEKEKLNSLIEKFKLSDSEHSKILKKLTSSLFANFKPTDKPVAYFIIGQPGVGKTTYINGQNLSHLVYINADHYRKLHTKAYEILNAYPQDYVTLTSIDANKLANEVMNYATKHNYSFLRERAPRSLTDFLDLLKTIPAHYKIVIDVFACGNINSILSTRERFEMQRNNGDAFVKLTSFDAHNQIYDALPQIVNALCDLNLSINLVWRKNTKTPGFNKLAYNGNKNKFVKTFHRLRTTDNKKHYKNIDKRISAIKQSMLLRAAPPDQFENLKMVEEYCKKEGK